MARLERCRSSDQNEQRSTQMTSNNLPAFASGDREFDLHLHVLEHGCDGRAPRYTIGVWEHNPQGAVLRAICHIRSLAEALLAIMGELNKSRRPESVGTTTPRAISPTHLCAVRSGSLSSCPSPERPAPMTSAVFMEANNAPSCRNCGCLTRRNGSCFICENCGASTGCS
jgi:hypothetical protein